MRLALAEDPADRFLEALRGMMMEATLFRRQQLQMHRLTMTQFFALNLLEGPEPQRISDLARRLELSHPAATNLVDALEARHLVTRRREGRDRREIRVHLTPAGRALLLRVHQQFLDQARKVAGMISPDHRGVATEVLTDLQGSIRRLREGGLAFGPGRGSP